MIPIGKETKIKLLKAIKAGQFDGDEFPELLTELKKIQIELISRRDQVIPDDEPTQRQLEERIIE
jgi:hypothetical protein